MIEVTCPDCGVMRLMERKTTGYCRSCAGKRSWKESGEDRRVQALKGLRRPRPARAPVREPNRTRRAEPISEPIEVACPDCGSVHRRRPGSNGYCQRCEYVALRRALYIDLYGEPYWTRERIIAAIQRWEKRTGKPPVVRDWRRSNGVGHGGHMKVGKRGSRPCVATVQREFGSWNAGLIAAGYEPRALGTPGHQEKGTQ